MENQNAPEAPQYAQPQQTQYMPQYAPPPQYAPQQPQYAPPQFVARQPKRFNALGLIGMITSVVSATFCWFPFIGLFGSIAGVILSALGLKKNPKGFAIAGIIVGGIFFLVSVFFTIGFISNNCDLDRYFRKMF